jgi:hypothetical protein
MTMQKEDNMTPTMMMPNQETMKKITGNVAVEVSDATYRLAARLLVQAVLLRTKNQLGHNNAIKDFLDTHDELGEAIIGFALAAILELVPTNSLMETKQRIAYNLRVQSYQDLGELLLVSTGLFTGLLDEEVERALRLAGVQAKPTVQNATKTNAAAGAGYGPDTAAAAPAGD